mmetsp:Transcript_6773/g.16808  ORF Transcript_6773/g.16808 Transcript_6773/m.16808 type:complete len:332 (+) Transcript_6773:948-1943(+)
MTLPRGERGDNVAQRRERLVDVQRFLEAVPRGLRLGQTLRSGQVHQAELGPHHRVLHHVVLFHFDDHDEVRARRPVVHLGRSSCAVLHPSMHQRLEFRRTLHRLLQRVGHVHLAHVRQLHLVLQLLLPERSLGLEKVADGFVINFHQRHTELVLVRTPRLLGHPEDLRESPGGDAGICDGALHGVRLPAARLTVGKDAHIEPVHHALNQRLHVRKHLLLRAVCVEHPVVFEELLSGPRVFLCTCTVCVLQPDEPVCAVVRGEDHRDLCALVELALTHRTDAAEHPDIALGRERLVEKPAFLADERADADVALRHCSLEVVALSNCLCKVRG